MEINVVSDDNVNTDLVTYKNKCIKLNKNKEEIIPFYNFDFVPLQ